MAVKKKVCILRHTFYTLNIFIKILNPNIKNPARQTIEKTILNI